MMINATAASSIIWTHSSSIFPSCMIQTRINQVKLVLPRSRLRPRTFRIGVGQSVLLGGVGRVDVTGCPHATMYVTVWASSDVSLWMGKTDNAEERYAF